MRVVLIDWLGRGGIAQTSEAWAIELGAAGHEVVVVTRAGRELGAGPIAVVQAPRTRLGRIGDHRAVAAAAIASIRELRPDVVVVQNYVIPALERPVHRAARRAGARVIQIVHDHRVLARFASTSAGLPGLLRAADVVCTHSRYVGDAVTARAGVQVVRLRLPVQLGLLSHDRPPPPVDAPDGTLLAVHFGVLSRAYKGTETFLELARKGVSGWSFAILGTGATAVGPEGLLRLPGFLDPGELAAAVEQSAASLFPYVSATQSGAIVLAKVLGSVPVSNDVGGLSEQIEDGVSGLLIAPDAGIAAWASAMEELSDESRRSTMAARAKEQAWDDHRHFAREIDDLVAGR